MIERVDKKQEILDDMKKALDLLRKIHFDLDDLNQNEQFDTNTSSKLYIFYDIKSVLGRIEKTIEA